MSDQEKILRTITGTVVSNKMDKTITVAVERRERHPMYGKYVRKTTKLHAHDADNVCNVGDVVTVTSSRPLSKTKTWSLVEVIEQASEV